MWLLTQKKELSAQHALKALKIKDIFNYIFRNQNVK